MDIYIDSNDEHIVLQGPNRSAIWITLAFIIGIGLQIGIPNFQIYPIAFLIILKEEYLQKWRMKYYNLVSICFSMSAFASSFLLHILQQPHILLKSLSSGSRERK